MSLTRAQVEISLISRVGRWLTNASLDGETNDGTNESLNDAIAYAIRVAGGTVADLSLVTNGDFSAVAAADTDKLLDVAELRTLENVLSNFTLVDAKAGPVEAKQSQFADRLERVIARLRSQLAIRYGIESSATMTTGAISLNFTELDDNVYIIPA